MINLYQGTTGKFDFEFPSYPASDWSAEFIVKLGTTSATFTATENGDAFEVKILPADSANLSVGINCYAIKLTNKADATEIAIAQTGEICVLADPLGATDSRSQFEQDLEAVDAAIRAIIEGGAVKSYEIQTQVGRRQLERMDLDQLRAHRRWLRGMIDEERVKMGKKPRMSSTKKTITYCP